MKARIYLRVAKSKNGFIIRADKTPNHQPIKFGEYRPTVLIAFDLDIPDKEFDASRILLEAKIKSTEPAVEIEQVMEEKTENGENDQGSKETD